MQKQTNAGAAASANTNEDWSAYRVLQQNHAQLVTFFKTLSPPSVEEMDGEFRLGELAQQSLLQRLVVLSFSVKTSQLCKAFEPTSATGGHGYNGVVSDSGVERKMFFEISVRPSRIDGRDSLYITYDKHNPDDRVLRSVVDELRKVKDGLYLGLGYAGETGHQKVLWPFMLEGPQAPFVKGVIR